MKIRAARKAVSPIQAWPPFFLKSSSQLTNPATMPKTREAPISAISFSKFVIVLFLLCQGEERERFDLPLFSLAKITVAGNGLRLETCSIAFDGFGFPTPNFPGYGDLVFKERDSSFYIKRTS